jgi:hypothetical protein
MAQYPPIVQVNVSQIVAPTPNQLQRTGAFISQGATTLAVGKTALLTQASDLIPLVKGATTIQSMTWSVGVVTVVLTAPHGITVGDSVQGIIGGVSPSGYNGMYTVTATTTTAFTYLSANYGAVTTQGIFTLEDVSELTAMVITYFAQGNANAVYILELGAGTPAQGVTALTAYINDPTIRFYGYVLPYAWATETTAVTLANNNSSNTAQVYFWVSVTGTEYEPWLGIKSAVLMYYDPVVTPITEFTICAMFWVAMHYNPSATNKVTPMAFSYVIGVTAPVLSKVKQQTLKTANCNFIGTGAEGGISNKIILWGVTADGRDYTYWYSVDWVQINIDLDLSNAIINGSNNPVNPLYYDQNGINTLQTVAQSTMNNGISFGLVVGLAPVTATPFVTYVKENPSDYPLGIYKGLAVTYTPNRGFTQIVFNVVVTDFVQV